MYIQQREQFDRFNVEKYVNTDRILWLKNETIKSLPSVVSSHVQIFCQENDTDFEELVTSLPPVPTGITRRTDIALKS